MNHIVNSNFNRTDLGEAELKKTSLVLTRIEQVALVAISKATPYAQLRSRFSEDEELDVIEALRNLEHLGLIESDVPIEPSSDTDLLRSQIDSFTSTDFFSSSLDPMRSGSGLVVDTKTSSMLPVKPKKPKSTSEVEVDFLLPLDVLESKAAKKSRKSGDAVSVFPEPKPVKKRRKSKKELPPEPKWKLALYIGLMVTGVALALLALFFG